MNACISNISILPYSEGDSQLDFKKKLKVIKLIKFFAEESLLALTEFSNSNMLKFDPHVSENLCQIRAYKFSLLVGKKIQLFKSIKHSERFAHLQFVANKAKLCLKNIADSNEQQCIHSTLIDFVKHNHLFYEYHEDEFFIVGSYFLTKFNQKDMDGVYCSINYNRICAELAIDSKTFATKISHRIQRTLSQISCNFIENILQELPHLSFLSTVLPYLKMQDEVLRPVLPCYLVTEIILAHMILIKKSFIIRIHFKSLLNPALLLMQFKPKNNQFYIENIKNIDPNFPQVVFDCVTDSQSLFQPYAFRHKLQKIGIQKIIMSNMAAHPQFAGKKLIEFKENPFNLLINDKNISFDEKHLAIQLSCELEYLKAIAYYYGCTISNKNLLLIKHIYCARPFDVQLGNRREKLTG